MSMTAVLAPPRTGVTVRAATPDDADLIHTLTQAAYAEYAATRAPSSVTRETANDLRDVLERGGARAAIAEIDGRPVGSVRYRRDGDALYFFRLGVLSEARGCGVAKSLLHYLTREARRKGAMKLRCSVRATVRRNVGLYESSGFVRVGLERVYRGEKVVDLLMMEKGV
jgi:ribosomal protein S18 acetylase RimI-like enzyme